MTVRTEFDKEELAPLAGQYKLRPMNDEETKRNEESDISGDDIPAYRIQLDLNDDQQTRLMEQFKIEFKALKDERNALGLPQKWAELDNQYEGTLRENSKLSFNIHVHSSKIKTDAVVRALNEAFIESVPMIDVSPRPAMWAQQQAAGEDVCEKQGQFLEFEIQENIKPQASLTLISLCAVKKFVGIGKREWCYDKQKRRREEVYEGKIEETIDATGKVVYENKALKEFVNNYPNWKERGYSSFYNKIAKGNTARLVVQYLDTLENSAKLRHVDIENFYVKNSTNYYEGLKTAHITVERESMTWWELEEKERNDEFENIEDLKVINTKSTAPATGQTENDYKTRDYDILKATIYFKMEETDDEETKLQMWVGELGEERYVFLGAILFPWYGFDTEYIPFYVKLNNDGFYGAAKSVMSDLKHSNIAQNVLINMALHTVYLRNTLTPIVQEGSQIAEAFIENRWQDGKPLEVDAMGEDVNKAIGFVEYPQVDLNAFLGLGTTLGRIDDAVSGISQMAATGRESPTDPHAPAAKTIALLNQSSINIKDYINTYKPSFEIFISDLLQMYYQMSQEGRKFQIGKRAQQVTGIDPFMTISRDEMVAKTTIQSRAAAFAFDKAMEKQEASIALQGVMMNPMSQIQPELAYEAFKIWLQVQGDQWRNLADNTLKSPMEFRNYQLQLVLKGLQIYLQQAQAVGGAPQLQPLMQQVQQALVLGNNPALQAKLNQKQQSQGGQPAGAT
jgi:hypothetical protein